MDFEKALELSYEKRTEYVELLRSTYKSKGKKSKGGDTSVPEKLAKLQQELKAIEKPLLSEFLEEEFDTLIVPVQALRSNMYNLLMEYYFNLEEKPADLLKEFSEFFLVTLSTMQAYRKEELIPFLDRHGITFKKFTSELESSDLYNLLCPLSPIVELPADEFKKVKMTEKQEQALLTKHTKKQNELLDLLEETEGNPTPGSEAQKDILFSELKEIERENPELILNALLEVLYDPIAEYETALTDILLFREKFDPADNKVLFSEQMQALVETINEFIATMDSYIVPFCDRNNINADWVVEEFIEEIDLFEDYEDEEEE